MNSMKDALTKQYTIEERCEMASWLIKNNVEEILSREVIKAKWLFRDKVDITLKASQCKDSDEDIRTFLAVYWFTDIKVSSDFPWYCESYEWTTNIKFKV